MRAWCSNNAKVKESFAKEDKTSLAEFKVLGYLFVPSLDCFILGQQAADPNACTKGQILSCAANTLGFVTSYLVRSKLILRQVTVAKLACNKQVSSEIPNQRIAFSNNFHKLQSIKIPRKTKTLMYSRPACKVSGVL